MVFAGNEYESIGKLCNATGLVIGYVETCENHPESDHLHICNVNIGSETVQILCGAPNVQAGEKVGRSMGQTHPEPELSKRQN